MCGIAGFYPLTNKYDAMARLNIAREMEGAIAHRGPDRGDIWQDEDSDLTLIHRRLAIIDLSDDGAQPMRSPSGRYIVSFNGEIYNYPDLRRQLEMEGIRFKGASDTEVMLAGFDVWGIEKTLQQLNGMFVFALFDTAEKNLHFARDRFGKKPLYIGWVDDALVFASELKSFHKFPNFQKEINKDVLGLYMKYGYVHAPYSIYKNVWQLLPAAMLSFNLNDISANQNLSQKMKPYWLLKDVAQKGKAKPVRQSESLIIDEFEEKLEIAVSSRMLSDVPLGAFLSGGIDSSTIVALMQKQSKTPVKTFTAGFEQEGFNEAGFAKDIATHLGTNHHEFYCSDQDALDVIPNLATIYDEPFADQSQIPTYLISKMAREHVTVVLTGDGGDEILGGYDRHTKIPPLWNKVGFLPQSIRSIICKSLNIVPQELYGLLKSGNPHFGAQVKRALGLLGLKDASEIYDALVSASINGNDYVLNSNLPDIPLKDENNWPNDLDFMDQMIFGDTLSYRANDLMVKTDRASMAVALEARAPLMDYELAEYTWTLPSNMKVRNGQGKWLLREVLKKHVPETLFDRPKMGFSVPLNQWLKGPLNEWANDLLSKDSLKSQGLLDADAIHAQWQDFQDSNGFQNVRKDLWSVLMFQSWCKQWK